MKEVVEKAWDIASNYFEGKIEFKEAELNEDGLFMGDMDKYEHEWKKMKRESCNMEFNGETQYESHIKSKKHQKISNKQKNYERNMEMKMKYQKLKEQKQNQDEQEVKDLEKNDNAKE